MKYEKIIDLLREVEKSGVEEFELEKENFRIRIKKSSGSSREPEGEAQPDASVYGSGRKTEDAEVSIQEGTIIRSPLVGVFHSAGSQEGETSVTLGSRVEAGQVLVPLIPSLLAYADERCSIRMCRDDLGNISEG